MPHRDKREKCGNATAVVTARFHRQSRISLCMPGFIDVCRVDKSDAVVNVLTNVYRRHILKPLWI